MAAPQTFASILDLVTALPGPDTDAIQAAAERVATREADQPGALGRLGDLAGWLMAWSGGAGPVARRPRLARVRMALFLGPEAPAARAILAALEAGDSPVAQQARALDLELRAHEMALDLAPQPLSEDNAVRAMAYGMMAVEPGLDAMLLATVLPAAAVAALASPPAPGQDPLARLAAAGGHGGCAVLGAVLAARLARIPVVLDDAASLAAAAPLATLRADALDHCLIPVATAEPAQRTMLRRLDRQPLMTLGGGPWGGLAALASVALLRMAGDVGRG